MTIPRVLVASCMLLATGCAMKATEQAASSMSTAPSGSVTPDRQYMCVTRVYLSEFSRDQQVPVDGNRQDLVPVGAILASQLDARFWVDSAVVASGRPQPTATAGFGQGTVIGKSRGVGNRFRAQVALQIQLMKPTGQTYYDTVGGLGEGSTAAGAATQGVDSALQQMEALLETAGICRRVQ